MWWNRTPRAYRSDAALGGMAEEQLGRHVVEGAAAARTHQAIAAGLVEARQAEIGDDRAEGSVFGAGENDVAALEVAVDDALAMGLSEPGADLARDLAGLLFRYGAVAVNAFGERLPLDELHGEEVEVAQLRGGGMQVVDLADVEVADLAGGAGFGRKAVAVTELGAFEGDAAVELFVDGLEDDAHAAEADLADDAEAIVQEMPGHKRVGQGRAARSEVPGGSRPIRCSHSMRRQTSS